MPGQNLIGQCTANTDCAIPFGSLELKYTVAGTATRVITSPVATTITDVASGTATVTLSREKFAPLAGHAAPGAFQLPQYRCCCPCRWGILPPVANQDPGLAPWVILQTATITTVHTDTGTPANNFTKTSVPTVVWAPNKALASVGSGFLIDGVALRHCPCRAREASRIPVATGASVVVGSLDAGFFPVLWHFEPTLPTPVLVEIETDGSPHAAFFANSHWTGLFEQDGSSNIAGVIDPCLDAQDHVITVHSTSSYAVIGGGSAASDLLLTAEFKLF